MTLKRNWVVTSMAVYTAATGLRNKHRSTSQRVKKQCGKFCLPTVFYSQLLQPSPSNNKHNGWSSPPESISLPGSRDLCKPGFFFSLPTLKDVALSPGTDSLAGSSTCCLTRIPFPAPPRMLLTGSCVLR